MHTYNTGQPWKSQDFWGESVFRKVQCQILKAGCVDRLGTQHGNKFSLESFSFATKILLQVKISIWQNNNPVIQILSCREGGLEISKISASLSLVEVHTFQKAVCLLENMATKRVLLQVKSKW